MTVQLRSAAWSDLADLLDWRNDAVTRDNSLTSQEIAADQHANWFRGVLDNPQRKIYIAVEGTESVGMIRLDKAPEAGQLVLSWLIAPTFRGRGLGTKILTEICNHYSMFDLIAEIKNSNLPSQAMATRCGFRRMSVFSGVEKWVRYRIK